MRDVAWKAIAMKKKKGEQAGTLLNIEDE